MAIGLNLSVFGQQPKITKLETVRTNDKTSSNALGDVILDIVLQPGMTISILQKIDDGNFAKIIATFGDASSTFSQNLQFKIQNLEINDKFYTYQLVDNNNTANTSPQITSIPIQYKPDSNPVELKIGNMQNFGTSIGYNILIKCYAPNCPSISNGFFTERASPISDFVNYNTNNKLNCGEIKSFQVEIQLSGGVFVKSEALEIIGKTNTRPAENPSSFIFVTTDVNNKCQVVWENSEAKIPNYTIEKEYFLERSDDNGTTFKPVATGNALKRGNNNTQRKWSFIDNTSDPTKEYVYRVKYDDYCNNTSDFVFVKNIRLLAVGNGNYKWDIKEPFKYSNLYMIVIPKVGIPQEIEVTGTSSFNNPQVFEKYQLKAILASGQGFALSNVLDGGGVLQAYAPDIFTPDGNGINDVFKVTCLTYTTFKISIYNHAGRLMYQSKDYNQHTSNGWAGTDAEEGVYTYQVNVTNNLNVSFSKKGAFLLVRKK